MIGKMLQGYPSKPAVVIAVMLIIGVMSYYYYDRHKTCTSNETIRSQLYSMAKKNLDSEIQLKNVFGSQWNNMRIIVDYKTEGKLQDCPFGWGWTEADRQELMNQEMLNMIVFSWNGVVTSYLDIDRNMIDFELKETLLSPETAVFLVKKQKENKSGFLLHQNSDTSKTD